MRFLSLFALLTLALAHTRFDVRSFHIKNEEPKFDVQNVKAQTFWFDQHLDHFDEQNDKIWKQRAYINTEYEKPDGPVFIYIGGESELSISSVVSGEIVENAKKFGAAMLGLEHRYYGRSQPFSNEEGGFSTQNLKWLSSKQALADFAYFVETIAAEKGWKNRKWISYGGSYPGALSAWTRMKFPHLIWGSIASSAPVLAKMDFFEYDQVTAQGVGPECAATIRRANAAVEAQLDASPEQATAVRSLFTCSAINVSTTFLYTLADAVSYAIQYTNDDPSSSRFHLKDLLCDTMQRPAQTDQDLINNYANFTLALFKRLGTSCVDFTTNEIILKNTNVSPDVNQRQWYYQSCTEFGYFQTAPAENSLRSTRINLQYHLDLCKEAFGLDLVPAINQTNSLYGADKPRGQNIIFPNGSLDPWKALSLTKPIPDAPSQYPIVINGTSHCADLHAPSTSDPESLVQARAFISSKIAEWLQQDAAECPFPFKVCGGVCVDLRNNPNHCGACNISVNIDSEYCLNGQVTSVKTSEVGKEFLLAGSALLAVGAIALFVGLCYLKKAKPKQQEAYSDQYTKINNTV